MGYEKARGGPSTAPLVKPLIFRTRQAGEGWKVSEGQAAVLGEWVRQAWSALRPYRREGSIPAIDQSDHPNPCIACMMEWVSELAPRDAAKAVAHPLRAAILERLYDREASPAELAREMGESLPNIAYHARVLHELGALALVRQRQVRGAVQHVYTATVRISLTQEQL